MSTKLAKVIAFELGVLIAVLIWMAAVGLPTGKPQLAQAAPPPEDNSYATVSPVYQPQASASYPVDYPADQTLAEDNQAPQTVRTYTQPIATSPYASTPYAATFPEQYANQDPANSIGVFPEPVLYSSDYLGYNPYYGYAQPAQIVILSNNCAFPRRARGSQHFGRPAMANSPRVNGRMPRGNGVARPQARPVINPRINSVAPRSGAVMRGGAPGRLLRPGQAVRAHADR